MRRYCLGMKTTPMANETADYNDLLPGRWVLVQNMHLGRVVRVEGETVTVRIERRQFKVSRGEVTT